MKCVDLGFTAFHVQTPKVTIYTRFFFPFNSWLRLPFVFPPLFSIPPYAVHFFLVCVTKILALRPSRLLPHLLPFVAPPHTVRRACFHWWMGFGLYSDVSPRHGPITCDVEPCRQYFCFRDVWVHFLYCFFFDCLLVSSCWIDCSSFVSVMVFGFCALCVGFERWRQYPPIELVTACHV